MPPLHTQLERVLHEVWALLLAGPLETGCATEPPPDDSAWTASIRLDGVPVRALTLQCPLKLASQLTEEMLCMEPGEADASTIQDVLGELANVIGGHVKALLDQTATLSLPAVTRSTALQAVLPGGEETLALGFSYHGEPLRVALLTHPPRTHLPASPRTHEDPDL